MFSRQENHAGEEVAVEKREIIIVGAGPAGLMCAQELAQRGRDVLVLEKKREVGKKLCAGGLTAKTLRLGIPEALIERQFREVIIHANGRCYTVSDDEPLVAMIDRKRLGEWMLEECRRAGAEVALNCGASEIREGSLVTDGREIGYRYLVFADGSNSLGKRFLGAARRSLLLAYQCCLPVEEEQLEVYFDRELFGMGYCWVFPHAGWTAVGCGGCHGEIAPARLRENFATWLARRGKLCKRSEIEVAVVDGGYIGYRFGGKFLVGDAAGLASEVTGEGIYAAMISGREVARLIVDSSYEPKALEEWLALKEAHRNALRKVCSDGIGGFLLRRFLPMMGRQEAFKKKAKRLFITAPAP